MPSFPWRIAFAALAIHVTGCGGGYVSSARKAYGEGRYFEAEERLAAHERDVGRLPPSGQCDYALYRGLALLAVGDHAGAAQWLEIAREVTVRSPDALTAERKALLDEGLGRIQSARATRLVSAW